MTKLGLKNKEGNEITLSRVEITLKNPFYFGIMRVLDTIRNLSSTQPNLSFSEGLFRVSIADMESLATSKRKNILIIAAPTQRKFARKIGFGKRTCLLL